MYIYSLKHFKDEEVWNKCILITGCDSGFGKATAKKLSELGYTVIATCLKQSSVDEFNNDESFNEDSVAFKMDVTDLDDIETIRDEVTDYLIKNEKFLWGIVNNAGIQMPGYFETISDLLHDAEINVLLKGPVNVTKTFLPNLYGRSMYDKDAKYGGRAVGGRIVNVTSELGSIRLPGFICYSPCKAALNMFTDCLRREVSPRFGIWCSRVEPGLFKTSIFDATAENARKVQKECEKEIWDMYNMDQRIEGIDKTSSFARDDLSPVVDAIVHGLTAKYPKIRYQVGWGIPGRLSNFSVSIQDKLLALFL